MKKKKILISIDWFLPGTKSGGPVRSYANIIAHFKNEYDFYIITRDTDYCEVIPYTSIESDAWNRYNQNTQIYYISSKNLNIKNLKEIYTSKPFDIALINGIYSLYFSVLPLLLLRSYPIKKIVSPRGMLNSQAFSSKRKKKKIFLFLAKVIGLYKKIFFHATNKIEATCIENELGANTTVIIAPNLPRLVSNRKQKHSIKNEGVLNLVSIARISKEKGTLTALEGILACTNLKKVKINFHLYGTLYDIQYWEKCKSIIKLLPRHVEVVYKGNLASEKVLSTLETYDFLLMPSEGENFGHSILESFSAGTPVIISDNTPWRDLEEKKIGWDVSLKSPKNLQYVLDLAINMRQNEYRKWSTNAFNFAIEFCNNKEILKANRALFNK
tara:strand:- start:10676 stop:11830 length:1155 start_codon:yes stop_codon:yes gene_type:complete